MKLSRREILETFLFDSEKIVTVISLSRHANISIDEATNELNDFYEKNKSKHRLYIVYVVSGEMKDSRTNRSCNRVQLVRQESLDRIKALYTSVDTCELFCLHSEEIKNLYYPYSSDRLDDEEFMRTDPERSWIYCPTAQIKRAEIPPSTDDDVENGMTPPKVPASSDLSATKELSTKIHSDSSNDTLRKKGSLSEHIENQKGDRFGSTVRSKSNPAASKKRRQRAVCSERNKNKSTLLPLFGKNSDNDAIVHKKMKLHEELRKSASPVKYEEASSKIGPTKGNSTSQFSDADLFSCGLSSSESDFEGNLSNLDLDAQSQTSTHLLSKQSEEIATEKLCSQQKATKKILKDKYMSETFVDKDGFLVTKTVKKKMEIPVDVDEFNPPIRKAPENVGNDKKQVEGTNDNKKTGRVQSKLSFFFKGK